MRYNLVGAPGATWRERLLLARIRTRRLAFVILTPSLELYEEDFHTVAVGGVAPGVAEVRMCDAAGNPPASVAGPVDGFD